MWNSSIAGLPSVLIVQNKSGNVFIVDNNSGQSQVERILQKKNKTEILNKTVELTIKSREASPIPIR